MAKALSELDSLTSSLAQNKINDIIFQAQAGLLTQEMQTQRVIQPSEELFSANLTTWHAKPSTTDLWGQWFNTIK